MTYLRLELGGDAEIGALGELDHVLLVCVWWVDRSGVKNAGVIYQIHIQRAGVCAVNNTSPATTNIDTQLQQPRPTRYTIYNIYKNKMPPVGNVYTLCTHLQPPRRLVRFLVDRLAGAAQ